MAGENQKRIANTLHNGIPVEPMFSIDGYEAFCNIQFKDDDLVALTYPKCGTAYLQKILYFLTRLDDDGNLPEDTNDIAGRGQVYLDWLHHTKGHFPFVDYEIDDMLNAPSPRIFSTHLRAELLPTNLNKSGKVLYMVRNPKDSYVSMHAMLTRMQKFCGGWLGTDEHQGSFDYYMEGRYFDHLRAMQNFADEIGPERFLPLYYEDMLENFDENLVKLAFFLDIPLTPAKHKAIATKTSFSSMQAAASEKGKSHFRKGINGDWKNHVDTIDENGFPTPSAEQWAQFDTEMNKLANLPLAAPLFKWL